MSPTDPKEQSERAEGPIHRRGFFTEGLRNILRPLADIVENRLDALNSTEWSDGTSTSSSGSTYGGEYDSAYEGVEGSYGTDPSIRPLRPPGALPEGEFLARCTSSGHCVQACPVSAIRLIWSGDPTLNGKPSIEPDVQACVLCEDLSCMSACPSGALQPSSRESIRIGTAVLRREHCLRTGGEDCQICVDKCPMGRRAIDVPYPGADVVIGEDTCTGCGVCEMSCPTRPRAIVVENHEE